MPFITPKAATNQQDEKFKTVDDILSALDYYSVLGITKNASADEIRRNYIKKSRICHPDKFVPAYPPATESFQLLSIAYETLNNPSSRLIYDLSHNKQNRTGVRGRYGFSSTSNSNIAGEDYNNPHQTLQRVLHQLFIEMLEGEFETMRAFIHALNETNPAMHITEDAVAQIELGFRRMRELVLSTHHYYKAIQFELMKLYELQHELRSLSYFSLWKRMQLSITICKTLLHLPIIINNEFKQKSFTVDEEVYNDKGVRKEQQYKKESISLPRRSTTESVTKGHGILNPRIEGALLTAVNLLEAGEKYVKAW